jgi:hypothetical protein
MDVTGSPVQELPFQGIWREIPPKGGESRPEFVGTVVDARERQVPGRVIDRLGEFRDELATLRRCEGRALCNGEEGPEEEQCEEAGESMPQVNHSCYCESR